MSIPAVKSVVRFQPRLFGKPVYWWYFPFALQWIGLLIFSTYQYRRFALTHDFSLYWQAVWLIAHGHLNPYASMDGFPFIDNHFELIMWPISLLFWIWPHGSLLLYIQDTALVGAEWIAWYWIKDLVASWPSLRDRQLVHGISIAVLILNPWVPWTAATDFHSESLIAFFISGAAYALYRRRNFALVVWSALSLACGDVASVTLAAVGLSGLLTKRFKAGMFVILSSISWLEFISLMGGNRGSILILIYGYLLPSYYHGNQMTMEQLVLALIQNPDKAVHELWQHRLNLYANLSPTGMLGLVSPWALPLYAATVIISNLSSGYLFGVPGFQNVMFYMVGTVGTFQVVSALWSKIHSQRIRKGILVIILLNSVGWAAVWIPQLPRHWVRVTPDAAQTLGKIHAMIPSDAEVIAPQGLMGRFANRIWLFNMGGHSQYKYPVKTRTVYIVMAPYDGVHFTSLQTQASWLNALAHNHHAHLIFGAHNVYLWKVESYGPFITLPHRQSHLPAWPFNPTAGYQVDAGQPKRWYLTLRKHAGGNVLDKDYWREPEGPYLVSVTLSSWEPTSIQVWDATTGHLLLQRDTPTTNGIKVTYHFPFDFYQAGPANVFAGLGPWRISPAKGLLNELEIRVYAKSGGIVNIYAIGIQDTRHLRSNI
ncbi:DUF2079 domain-containing protein [Sulfobacillus thermosulfidooxidans]|uniref:DUF2079 domain-containing protein n=1 Tax=Sulfobacillus thermosulfidooxidans TaxID=28034 RepID=UPI00096B80E8|nr:DUF2079 domain-containing protein [Sulfobacillus thermosulfidooxidans]OLZ10232.1 hypothetical protein BFX05_10650 [Sulfobacillus thermosulfidooxidans]OLZ17024.1 hypothetical protein BFX06_13860 [Sulfobacillus thermosulfidooxidans]OLZ20120.1 hypothetical protein BFX07_00590 [Sulfobacillus thermosulfidooxidans]